MKTNTTSKPIPTRAQGLILVVLATVFWSTSGIFINLTINGSGITAVGLAFYRDMFTFLSLLVGIAIIRPKLLRIKRGDIPWFLAMGALSIGSFHVLWNTSVMLIGASLATVIQCNAPIVVTVMAWLLFGEALTRRKIIAIILSIVGTILTSGINGLGGVQITTLGILIALASAIAYGSFSLFGKKLSGTYNPWTILLYVFGFATLTLLPFQFGQPAPWPLPTNVLLYFASLVFLTTIAGFGFYTTGLGYLQASIASITSTSEVAFAGILAYIVLGERLSFLQIIGSLLIVGGVIIISVPNRKNVSDYIISDEHG
ncbi:MAG: EamA family transporter [Chloroflexota bacterium]|nr:EamA family transporter [Chloroflexota bacterium]